jgi:TatD DNase family protein
MYLDTHAHLTYRELTAELPQVLERASAAGVNKIITVGTTLDDSRRCVDLANGAVMAPRPTGRADCAGSPQMYAAVGLHPGNLPEVSISQVPAVRELAKSPNVVAIGETGLDYFREARNDFALREQQKELFRAQLELARTAGLPVIIHNRAAEADMLEMLRPYAPVRGVMHCFSGDVKFAFDCIELGLFISYTGILTFPNAAVLREVAVTVGLEHVMLETDCPYLAPVPHRGKRNEPAFVPLIAQALAQLRGTTVEEVARVTSANAGRLFGLGGAAQKT